MKKLAILSALAGLVLFVVVFGNFVYSPQTGEVKNEKSASAEEVWYIETGVDGPEDCTEIEEYNPEEGVCYIECKDEKECAALEAKLDSLLSGIEEAHNELAGKIKPFKGDIGELEEVAEVAYIVKPGESYELVKGQESKEHKDVKRWLQAIAGTDISDKYFSRVVLYRKPGADTLAYVTPNPQNPGKWDIYVNMDSMKDGVREMIFTLIHEYMHILSLNGSQTVPHGQVGVCDAIYQVAEGCPKEGGYLLGFYKKFWQGKGFSEEAEGGGENYPQAPGEFLNEYAASNPVEDMAESFSAFVLNPKGAKEGLVKEKLEYFWQFPELVKTRETIRKSLLPLVAR